MATEEENTPDKELSNIRPTKVSLVDEGANAQFFFIAKSKEGTSEASAEDESLKAAIASFAQGILNRLESTREWLMQAETDEDSDIPSPIMSMLSRTRDELADMGESIEAGGNRLADAKVSGAKRDKMVSMLDVVGEKLAASVSTLLSDEGDDIPSEFVDELETVIDGFNAVIGKSADEETEEIEEAVWSTAYVNDLPDSAFLYIASGGEKDEDGKTVPRTNRKFPYKDENGKIDLPHLRNAIARIPQSNLSQSLRDELQAKARKILEEVSKSVEGPQEDNEMTIKFAEVAKSAEKIDLDQVEVKKQVGTATEKLNSVMESLALDTEAAKSMDNYDLRWKLGEAVDILVRAAKLEDMLGSGAVESQAPEEEEEEEEEEMSAEEKSAAEEKAAEEEEDEEEEKSSSDDAPVEKTNSNKEMVDLMKGVISEAVAPIAEKLETIEKDLGSTTEKVEKMERARPVSKGSGPDETKTPSNPEGGDDSIFTNIMPPHLQGTVKR